MDRPRRAIVVTTVGLVFGSLSGGQAIAAALGAWLFVVFDTPSAWMRPERYTASRPPVILVVGLAGLPGRRGRLPHQLAGATRDPTTGTRIVPPGLLLTLVENAIEHGVSPALRGGTIDVSAREDGDGWTLVVRNDGAALAPDWRDGVGLANCRERLTRLPGDRATLELATIDAQTVATVRVHGGRPA